MCLERRGFTAKGIHALWQGTPVAKDCQVFKLAAEQDEEMVMLDMSKDLRELGSQMPGTCEWK